MNQEETLALWKQGKEAWNAWAEKMLAERKALENKGEWDVIVEPWGEEKPQDETTEKWFKDARAVFSSTETPHVFLEATSFEGWLFPSISEWNAATFKGGARFISATFKGIAQFGSATFKRDALFRDTIFEGDAWFRDATFEGDAWFRDATFEGTAWFRDATFERIANFSSSTFEGVARFHSATFEGGAQFTRVTFERDTWFISATFKGISQFSRATFKRDALLSSATFEDATWFHRATFEGDAGFSNVCFEKPTQFSDARFNTDASFNAAQIKQAFDLSGARFKEVPDFRQTHCEEAPLLDDVHIDSTIVKQRKPSDKTNFAVTAKYRALKRLAIQGHDHKHEVEFFAEELKSRRLMVYTQRDPSWWLSFIFDELSDYGRSIARPLMYWLGVIMLSAVHYIAMATPLDPYRATECLAGAGSQVNTAYQLAFAKGLLVPGLADRTIVTQAYDCLFGDIIPGSAAVVAGIQTLLSAILLFLLLLGIRNRFKLK
ncbi:MULTISPECIES: pentapeptide repeat-containing protein [unclassified Thalassospira]|uniref:pentapeptide repeat-containing protein n=1 Tax=unclassified Thalassospira TaxID=2648997 RepID=UPI000A99D4BA|nr:MULTISPECIES: pentapeptide repeat-containing protein [unclassified Thalassospira]